MNARPSLFWSGVIAVGLTAAIGYQFFAPSASHGLPPLTAVPETLHVGPANPSSEYKHVLRIRNNTNKPVYVEEFVRSCTCADVSPSDLTVPPRGEASVSLTLDLLRYITPGREPTIRGELHIAPVASGKRLNEWPIAIEIIRPKILIVPAGEINFGTVYAHQSTVSAEQLVSVSDEIASENVTVHASSPSIRKITLEPVQSNNPYYRTFKLDLVLRDGHRPYGLERFAIAIRGPGEKTMEISSQIYYDSGIRIQVDERPPTIVHKGEEIQWFMRVYALYGNLSSIDVALEDKSRKSVCAATKEQMTDGTWRIHCRMTAHEAGNIGCKCHVAAMLASGATVVKDEVFRFYVPRSVK